MSCATSRPGPGLGAIIDDDERPGAEEEVVIEEPDVRLRHAELRQKVSLSQLLKNPSSDPTNVKTQETKLPSPNNRQKYFENDLKVLYCLSLAQVNQTEVSDEIIYHPRRRLFHIGLKAGISR